MNLKGEEREKTREKDNKKWRELNILLIKMI